MLYYTLKDSSIVEVEYKPITMISTVPAQDGIVNDFGGDYTFAFNTSDNSAVNFLTWEFWNMNVDTDEEPVLLRQNNRNRWTLDGNMLATNPKDQWTENINFFVGGSELLYEGKEYELRVKFYGMGLTPTDKANGIRSQLPAPYEYEQSLVCEYILRIKGGTKPYQFSDVTFTVDPDPDKYVIRDAENAEFTFHFSAPVDVDTFFINLGFGSTTSGGSKEANEDKTVWTLKLDPSQVAACLSDNASISWSMGANDANGVRVRGNDDISAGAQSLTSYLTNCDKTTPNLQLVSPVVDEDGYVSSLEKIVVTNASHYPMRAAANSAGLKARLLNRQGGELASYDLEVNPDDNTQIIFTTTNSITANGTYVFMVPENIIIMENGSEQGFCYNLAFDHLFQYQSSVNTITKDFIPHTVEPAHNSTVESLKKITLTFHSLVCLNPDRTKVQLYKDKQLVEEKNIEIDDLEWVDPIAYIDFSKEYTEAGNYEVVIPEHHFVDEAYDESQGGAGKINPELRYSYVVSTPTGVADIAVENGDVKADVYSVDGKLIMRNASAEDLKNLPAGVYIHGGKKVVR